MTNPLGMSGEEEWYEKYPYKAFECHECGNHCVDIPAILKEQRRLVIEECVNCIDVTHLKPREAIETQNYKFRAKETDGKKYNEILSMLVSRLKCL